MNNKKYLGKIIKIKIDRPLRSLHPKYNYVYPINYGYIPNTVSGDGEELDCYLLGVNMPILEYEGKCIAIIHRLNEDDDKLIIVPMDMEFNNDEIEKMIEFQEQYFKYIIIR